MNTKRSKLTVIFAMCTTLWICNACKKCDYDINTKNYMVDTVWINRDYTEVTPDGQGEVRIEYILVFGDKTAEMFKLDENHRVKSLWRVYDYKIKGNEIYYGEGESGHSKFGYNHIYFAGNIYFRASRGRDYYFRP